MLDRLIPVFNLIAGIHAREWISPAVVTYMMRELTENITGQQELVEGLDWYIVPVVNPDGYAYSWTDDRLWRKTRREIFLSLVQFIYDKAHGMTHFSYGQ